MQPLTLRVTRALVIPVLVASLLACIAAGYWCLVALFLWLSSTPLEGTLSWWPLTSMAVALLLVQLYRAMDRYVFQNTFNHAIRWK